MRRAIEGYRLAAASAVVAAVWLVTSAASVDAEGIAISYDLPQATAAAQLQDGELVLGLDDALAMALERNLSLIVERQNRAESEFRVFEALGIYDFNTTGTLSAVEETSPTSSALDGAEVSTFESNTLNLGLSRQVASGGVFAVDWQNVRTETNSTFSQLNPSYDVDFDLSFRQPLLRSRGRLSTERGLTIARRNLDISRETFEQQVIGVIRLVETEYWNVVEAREQLQVAEESLALAEELHEQNRIRVEVGTLAPLELVQSEAGVATRKEEIIRAEALLGDAEDRLRQILNLDQGPLWSAPLQLTTEAELEEIEQELDDAITTALGARPELRSKRLSMQIQDLDVAVAQVDLKPQLDLFVRYGANGLGGDLTIRDFVTREILLEAPGDYGDALDQVTDVEFDGWVVSLDFAYPIGNRAAKARSAIAEIARDRGEFELQDLELAVRTEVRRTYRFLSAAKQAVESAGVSRRLAERTLDAEQKRYDNGLSTSFQLLEIQEDLTAARSRQVSSQTAYRRAVIDFYSATGTLMDASRVTITDAESDDDR